jgi:hypothetical protein
MVAGNAVLFFTAVFIVQQKGSVVLDVLFWAVVAGLVLVRYVDIRFLKGSTAENEPATLRHWRRYSIGLVSVWAAVWIVAHAAAGLH